MVAIRIATQQLSGCIMYRQQAIDNTLVNQIVVICNSQVCRPQKHATTYEACNNVHIYYNAAIIVLRKAMDQHKIIAKLTCYIYRKFVIDFSMLAIIKHIMLVSILMLLCCFDKICEIHQWTPGSSAECGISQSTKIDGDVDRIGAPRIHRFISSDEDDTSRLLPFCDVSVTCREQTSQSGLNDRSAIVLSEFQEKK